MARRVKIVLILCFFLGALTTHAQKRKIMKGDRAVSEFYFKGKQLLLVQKDTVEAIKAFVKALQLDSLHDASNYELAELLPQDKALEYSIRANTKDSTNYWYAEQLAGIYASMYNFPEAIKVTERAIKLAPKNEMSLRKLATYYLYSNDVDKAIAMVDTIKNRFGDSYDIAYMHASMIRSLQNPTDEMLEAINGYATEYSDDATFSIFLGDIYMRRRDSRNALFYYKKAKLTNPSDSRTDVALYDYYSSVNNPNESIKYISAIFNMRDLDVSKKIDLYKSAIADNVYQYRNNLTYVNDASMALMQAHPRDMEVRNLYSQHMLNKGEIDGVLEFAKSGLNNKIFDEGSLDLIIQIEEHKERYDSVYHYLEIAKELMPNSARRYDDYRVNIYLRKGRYDDALKLAEEQLKGIDSDSLKTQYYCTIGDIYSEIGKTKQASKSYEKALKFDPENIIILNNYAYCLSKGGKNLDKALAMARKVLDKEPSNSTYIDTYAWVLYKLKRYNEAREMISRAVALDINRSPALMMHYGDILYRCGEKSLAELYWGKAAEYGEDKDIVEERIKSGPKE